MCFRPESKYGRTFRVFCRSPTVSHKPIGFPPRAVSGRRSSEGTRRGHGRQGPWRRHPAAARARGYTVRATNHSAQRSSAQASRSRPLRSYSSCRTAPRPPRSRVSYHIQTHAHTSAQIESAPARVYMHACTHLMISILFDCESAGSIFTVREKQFGSQLYSVRAD